MGVGRIEIQTETLPKIDVSYADFPPLLRQFCARVQSQTETQEPSQPFQRFMVTASIPSKTGESVVILTDTLTGDTWSLEQTPGLKWQKLQREP